MHVLILSLSSATPPEIVSAFSCAGLASMLNGFGIDAKCSSPQKKPYVFQKIGETDENATPSQFQAFLHFLQPFFPQ